jgi:type VI secretion system protein ImpM
MPMRCGLFGKLGSKRDFIALATPRKFLEIWEPWVQASISASRHQLGARWQGAFLTAPVWRFWLGADICGTTVAGAIMPSLDGVGRYYPLTLHAIAAQPGSIAPPDVNAQDSWFECAERFLLSTLARDASFDATSAALDALPVPALQPVPGGSIVSIGRMAAIAAEGDFVSSLTAMRAVNPGVYAGGSFWWTVGGNEFRSMALACHGLPDPFHYAMLLTGDTADAAGAA